MTWRRRSIGWSRLRRRAPRAGQVRAGPPFAVMAGAGDDVPASIAAGAPAPSAGPDDRAYVIYPSGSTGEPKGVMVPRRGILNRLRWMQDAFALGPADAVLH